MGCNLNCKWCHNPEGKRFDIRLQYDRKKCIGCNACVSACPESVHRIDNGEHRVDFHRCTGCGKCVQVCPGRALSFSGSEYTAEELAGQIIRDRCFYKEIGGVTFSGGEPLLQAQFLAQTARLCREQGVPSVAVDTAGLLPRSAFETVMPYVDHFLFDVKAVSEDVHMAGTGVSNKQILENLHWLDRQDKSLYIRVPVIPKLNDDPCEMEKIGDLVRGLHSVKELRLLPYHTFGREKYEILGDPVPACFPLPREEKMEELRRIARCF